MARNGPRIAMIVGGALAVLIGSVWIGQGLNLIPGSFMSGDKTWLYLGIALLVVGIIVLLRGLRPSSRRP